MVGIGSRTPINTWRPTGQVLNMIENARYDCLPRWQGPTRKIHRLRIAQARAHLRRTVCRQGNIFWAAVSQGLEYRDWWLNDPATFRFFRAIRKIGHRLNVPTRSRTEFERQREAYVSGDLTAVLLEPYLSFSGGGYFSAGCKGGDGRSKKYGVSAAGYEDAIRQCHQIMQKTQPRLTSLDWRKMGLESLTEEDVVFLDPPYPNSNVRSYTEDPCSSRRA